MVFHIGMAGREAPVDLHGVEASLVSADGRIVPVATSFQGFVRVPKQRIRELGATLILFCSPYTFCGAVRVSEGEFNILDFDEYYLVLAQLVVH